MGRKVNASFSFVLQLEYDLAFEAQLSIGTVHPSSIRRMVTEKTRHDMVTYALRSFTCILREDGVSTGTAVLGKPMI